MEGLHKGWGIKVRKRREALDLTQERLAQLTGLRQATISRIELGVQVPSDRLKWVIAGALGCSLDELFPWPAQVPPTPTPEAVA